MEYLIKRFIIDIETMQAAVKKDYLHINNDFEEQAEIVTEQEYDRLNELCYNEAEDTSSIIDAAEEVGFQTYSLLKTMRYRNLANWICCAEEIWEQQIYLLYLEIKQDNKKFNNFNQLINELEILGLPIGNMVEYHNLQQKRLLVNVIKHSEGASEEKLRKECPKYFDNSTQLFGKMDNLKTYRTSLGEVSLNITEEDFDETCFQIIEFWRAIIKDCL